MIAGNKLWYLTIPVAVLMLYYSKFSFKISNSDDQRCSLSKGENDYCEFLRNNCNANYFNIAIKFYCSKYYPSIVLIVILSIGIIGSLVLLLSSLSIIVSNYLFKNLNNLTNVLNINNQILSFILIPLTNALPDLINYYVALDSSSIDLVLGQVIGSNFIIFTVIIGLISFINPFSIENCKILLSDFIWVLAVLIIFSAILSDGKITLIECLIMITCYLIYIIYLNWSDSNLETDLDEPIMNFEEALSILSDEERNYGSTISIKSPDRNDELEEIDKTILMESANFLNIVFNIVDNLLFLMIPVLEEESNSVHNDNDNSNDYNYYNHLIQIWYCFEVPFLMNYQFFKISFINLLPITLLIIIIIYTIKIPLKFKTVLTNLIGIINSLILISNISIQILKILKNFGIILKISEYLLGLLIFSISNSINDLITNLTISTTINPLFGVNSCLGTPLLIILLGIGINGLLLILGKKSSLTFEININLMVSTIGLFAIIIFYLIYIPLNNWMFDKKLGIIVILWYVIISIINCLLG